MSTNFDNFWHKDGQDDRTMWGALIFHLTLLSDWRACVYSVTACLYKVVRYLVELFFIGDINRLTAVAPLIHSRHIWRYTNVFDWLIEHNEQ